MKNGWQTKALESVCRFSNGLWKGEKPPFVNVGVIRNTNFTKEGTLDDSDIAYLDVEAKKLEKRRLQIGDIILEKSGGGPKQPVGRVALFDKDDGAFSFSNFTAALRVLDSRELDFRFLHKFLHWTYLSGVTEGMQSHSTGIRNLDGDAYKAIQIPFPSLSEQRRIVSILDEAFERIATVKANAEKNLADSRLLFVRALNTVLSQRNESWLSITFGKVVIRSRGGISIESRDYCADGIPVLTKGDVKPFGRIEPGGKYVAVARAQSAAWPRTKLGELIVTTRDLKPSAPFLGLVAQIPVDREYVVSQGATFFAIDESRIMREFFVYWCCGDVFREHVRSKRVGSTQVHIRREDLFAAPVWVPPLDCQKRIVTLLDGVAFETSRLTSVYERKIAALEAMKKSLLYHAFAGQL
jgi:type I restriction enzyme S subunit